MKHLIASILLLALTAVASPAQSKTKVRETLSLTISLGLPNRLEGEAIPVKVVFKNTGRKPSSFVLPSNERDPPGFIWARLKNAQGALLTENDTLKDGWWTSWVLRSGTYKENRKDRISLKPGEEYTRSVDLSILLAGCPCLPKGLKAGTYRVQLALGEIVSNEIELTVGEWSRD
jgi:hypothetical protein